MEQANKKAKEMFNNKNLVIARILKKHRKTNVFMVIDMTIEQLEILEKELDRETSV